MNELGTNKVKSGKLVNLCGKVMSISSLTKMIKDGIGQKMGPKIHFHYVRQEVDKMGALKEIRAGEFAL